MFRFWILFHEKIILILLVYGCCMGVLRSIFYRKMFEKRSGGMFLNVINLVGTPVHEFGHFIFAIAFGMQVTEVCFYRTIRQAHDGRLGYVNVRMKSGGFFRFVMNTIGSFFVGIGPLLMGPAVIYFVYQMLPKKMKLAFLLYQNPKQCLLQISQFQMIEWLCLIIFLYLMIGISLNLELSKADIKMAWKGFIGIEILVMCFSIFVFYIPISYFGVLNQMSQVLLAMAFIGGVGALIGAILA